MEVPKPAPAPPVVITQLKMTCVQMKTYAKAQEQQVSAEMRSHPTPTAEDAFVVDYIQLRAEIRAACGQ
jgi:hypothetical protein